MKLVALMMLCAVAAAAPRVEKEKIDISQYVQLDSSLDPNEPATRNILLNALIRQLFNFIRIVIRNGSAIFGVPPLDPLELEKFNLNIPAGLINLELELEDILVTGIGDFVVHRSSINTRQLTFEIDISVPRIDVTAGKYNLLGDLFTAIPLYGKGGAIFEIENFRFRAMLFLKQSDDGSSVLIDRIEDVSFEIPHFKSKLVGVIGGGEIDNIVNAIVEDVLVGYINRFQGVISFVASQAVVLVANPVLDQLNTWSYLAPFV